MSSRTNEAGRSAAGPLLEVSIRIAGGPDEPDLVELARLLEALEVSPRMASAASRLSVSYRTAWGRVVEAERRLGLQLVERVKGHGSRLTDAGRALVAAVVAFEREARRRLRVPAGALSGELAALSAAPGPRALRLAASHDLLLQRCLAERFATGIEIRFVGSDDAVGALAAGSVELAGFHAPAGRRPAAVALPGGEKAFVVPLSRREQGLIVAPGNPLRIRDVADLARPGLRFVNRQRGAGTRAWLDRLLRDKGISPGRIAGYEIEEASHLAVAAAVAAGEADAGFGLKAAAIRFGLGFVPIGVETYWLAGSAEVRQDRRVRELVETVRRLARDAAGYGPVNGREMP